MKYFIFLYRNVYTFYTIWKKNFFWNIKVCAIQFQNIYKHNNKRKKKKQFHNPLPNTQI